MSLEDVEQSMPPLTRSVDDMYDSYYWCDGEKVPLTIDNNKYYVVVESVKLDSIKNIAINSMKGIQSGVNLSKNHDSSVSCVSFTVDNISQMDFQENDVLYSAPYFKASDGSEIGITNMLSVQLIEESSYATLQKIAAECHLEILGKDIHDPSICFLSCTKVSKGNSLEMANYIYESGICKYATPEFIVESKATENPNDMYFGNQWNLLNITNPNIDVDYVETITEFPMQNIGDIIVAVIDNGIYTAHEDLPLHIVSYDAHTGASPSELYGNHGTLVAGVIGATTNNAIGIAGIASGVKIMPISVCYTADGNRLNIPASTSSHFADAIRFAANNGAHIINNSWKFSGNLPMPEINSAIQYAHDKGCVVVFASGNDNSVVSQPAAGAPSSILVVGSIGRSGTRSSFSNYGTSLDIVAPGSDIMTTTWNGGYVSAQGTSFSAPHVSATAALMLSINPYLTNEEICSIIEKTAQKLPGYDFVNISNRLNGTWDSEVGYGLVNCLYAVSKAYYSNMDNYSELITFDYYSNKVEMDITTEDDVVIIWDWATKDMSFIYADSSAPVDTTISHIYSSYSLQHIVIAESIPPNAVAPTTSNALKEFKLSTAEYANNIKIKSINSHLRKLEIVGGVEFVAQQIQLVNLYNLESVYLRHLPFAQVMIGSCPRLKYFSTSPTIWLPNDVKYPGNVSPNVVIGDGPVVLDWPDVPEPVRALASLSIIDCPYLEQMSLENVNLLNVNFSSLHSLQYVYLSSQSDKIVSAPISGIVGGAPGGYLVNAVKTLPERVAGAECAIVIRGVNDDATGYKAVDISHANYAALMSSASANHWNVYWQSGYVF